MRWSLRNQILVPMLAVMLCVVATLSFLSAFAAARERQSQIEDRIAAAAKIIGQASFPLTQTVLEQIKGLTGAELLIVDSAGRPLRSTHPRLLDWEPRKLPTPTAPPPLWTDTTTQISGQTYYQGVLLLRGREPGDERALLTFYPRDSYQRQIRNAAGPAVITGVLASLIIIGLTTWIASQIIRPLNRLQKQFDRIAEGDFQQFPLPARRDELRDLAQSINRMAAQLRDYESRVRQTEQVHLLGLLGGGLAHQIRNAATGARMALDFHQQQCPHGNDESFRVAERQLTLIDQYLRRFLSIAGQQKSEHRPIDMVALVEGVLPLVGPAARHAGVQVQTRWESQTLQTRGDESDLQQVVLNLLLNAIEAAQASGEADPAVVTIELLDLNPEPRMALAVTDSGAGPPAEIAERLFEPLVSGKQEGIGLGLSIVQRVVADHGGTVSWSRVDNATQFRVLLPKVT